MGIASIKLSNMMFPVGIILGLQLYLIFLNDADKYFSREQIHNSRYRVFLPFFVRSYKALVLNTCDSGSFPALTTDRICLW